MSHIHKRVECKVCDKVLMRCRCIEGSKNIEYVVCEECERNENVPPDDVCCCGDAMENRESPLTCGHSAVSMRSYYLEGKKDGDGA